MTAEYSNNVTWLKNQTTQTGVAGGAVYPSGYYISGKKIGGSITLYDTENSFSGSSQTTDGLQFSESAPLTLKLGTVLDSSFRGFTFNFSTCSFTNRVNVGPAFTKSYEYRSTDNSTALSSQITLTS